MNNIIEIALFAETNNPQIKNKPFVKIYNKDLIWHICNRLNKCDYPFTVMVPKGDVDLIEWCKSHEVRFFEYISTNLLNCLEELSKQKSIEHVVKIDDSNFFIDVKVIQRVVNFHLKKENDYTNICLIPKGLECEVISTNAIKARIKENNIFCERLEFNFNPTKYKVDQYRPDYAYQYPEFRFCIEYPEDVTLAKIITENFHTELIHCLDLINFIKRTPSIRHINKQPKVSIYITNYNYGKYLEFAILSVLAQTSQDYEIIIIDDCSTDNSMEILKQYLLPNSKIKLIINQEKIGLPASANKAISFCRGEYIMRVDADDMLLPNAVEKMIQYMDCDLQKEIGILFAGYYECDEAMKMDKEFIPPYNVDENEYHPTGALIRRRNWQEVKYNDQLKGFESYEFLKRFKAKYNVGILKDIIWLKRKHNESMMYTNLEARKILKQKIDNDTKL